MKDRFGGFRSVLTSFFIRGIYLIKRARCDSEMVNSSYLYLKVEIGGRKRYSNGNQKRLGYNHYRVGGRERETTNLKI